MLDFDHLKTQVYEKNRLLIQWTNHFFSTLRNKDARMPAIWPRNLCYEEEYQKNFLWYELVSLVESIQVRACRIVLPNKEYKRACEELKLATLEERRLDAITKFFLKIQDHNHRLHHLLPPRRSSYYSLRHSYKYEPPKCKTKRHKDSPIPWCLFNLQWLIYIYFFCYLRF